MKKILTGFISLIGLFLILSPIFSSFVFAQSKSPTPTKKETKERIEAPSEAPPAGVNLTLSPTFISLLTDPGKEVTSQIRVTNNNNFKEYFELGLVQYDVSAQGTSTIKDIAGNDPFKDWISFSEDQFTLDPNESKTVRFTVSPPNDAKLGYYYAIVVKRIQPPSAEGVGPAVAGAPAIPLLLEVRSPNAKREVQLIDFKTDSMFYEYLPVNFEIKVKNTGNVHIVPLGDVFIDSMGKEDIAIFPANPGKNNVLPGTERVIRAVWEDGFAVRVPKVENGKEVKDDKGNTVYTTNYNFQKADKFRFGKYTANLLMVYDNGERDIPIEAKITFWVIPWKILGVGLVVVLLALFGLKGMISSVFSGMRRR